jgi:hypothetical protein
MKENDTFGYLIITASIFFFFGFSQGKSKAEENAQEWHMQTMINMPDVCQKAFYKASDEVFEEQHYMHMETESPF